LQDKLISAILMGTSLPVPNGADVGGAFKHIPVLSFEWPDWFASLHSRISAPMYRPSAKSRFGKAPEGMQAVCANPAALGGGFRHARRVSVRRAASQPAPTVPREPFRLDSNLPSPVDTAFVKVSGLIERRFAWRMNMVRISP